MLAQLEQQKATIDRAISALRELSRIRPEPTAAVAAGPTGVKKRRGRPPRNPQLSPATNEPNSASETSTKRAPSKGVRKKPVYTDDFKRRVVTAVRQGMSFGEASKKFKTTWFSVRDWSNSGRFEPAATAKKSAPAKATKNSAKKAQKPSAVKKRGEAQPSGKAAPSTPAEKS